MWPVDAGDKKCRDGLGRAEENRAERTGEGGGHTQTCEKWRVLSREWPKGGALGVRVRYTHRSSATPSAWPLLGTPRNYRAWRPVITVCLVGNVSLIVTPLRARHIFLFISHDLNWICLC